MAGISEPFWRASKASQRAQFRFRNEAFIPFHSTYPFHLTDVMDAVSPQSNIIRSGLVSPVRSNNIRGVREYEEEIRELRTKNFDLQFRICMLEELMSKQYKSCTGSDEEAESNVADVLIQLKLESKDLKNDLDSKDNQLVEALNQNKSYESRIKKLEKQLALQSETISAYADYPPLEEVVELKLSNEYVIEQLAEKEKSLQEYLNQIKAITEQNEKLDSKVKKCYLTIEGFVKKLKENTFPDKVNAAVKSALQAKTEEEFDTALGTIKSCLQQINLDTTSTLKENGSGTSIKQDSNEKTSMSSTRSSSSDSFMSSGQSKSKSNYDSTSKSADSLPISFHKPKTSSEIQSLLDENESQANIIRDQNITISNLECRLIQLQSEVFNLHTSRSKNKDEKSKVSISLNDASSQTTGQSPSSVEDSENLSSLKEELLRQMLIAEEKEKEICELQQQLQNIPSKDDTQSFPENEYYSVEKSELQQRLAASISTNKKLIGMLKNLEDFLESLLQNKDLDSSSFENTGFFSHISSLLDQSLKLSNTLSDNLTVCESSRIFDIADTTIHKNKDLASDSSQTINETSCLFPDNQFSHTSEQGNSYPHGFNYKSLAETGKRIQTLPKPELSSYNSENMVVLGTSNNEDLILVLNDHGDPKDVLIRSNTGRNLSETGDSDRAGNNQKFLGRGVWNAGSFDPTSKILTAFPSSHPNSTRNNNPWETGNTAFDQTLVSPRKINPWYPPCPSSDSDIWSEPDRDVSLRRIGIDIQNSPVSQRSPRKPRLRDKTTTSEISSPRNESSSTVSKLPNWSKRRRSTDTSRSSYVCKKCMEHQPSDVRDRTRHDSKIQAQDEQMITESSRERQSNLIDSLSADKAELSSCISQLKKELSELRDQKDNLETQLSLEKDATSRLRTTIYDLEKKLSEYDTTCVELRDELNETYSRLTNLDEKCSEYESRISLNAEKHSDELKSVDHERRELMKEIDVLISEKQNLLDSIRTEKNICKKLQLELKDKGNIIESLSSSNKELQEAQMTMHEEKKAMQSDLASLSDALSDQQSKQNEHLQKVESLQSKCDNYENEIESFAEFKSKTTEKLTQVRNDAIENLRSLTNLLKEYFNSEVDRSVDNGDSNSNAFAAMTRDKQIETLLNAISSLNFDLEETITSFYTQIPNHIIWTQRKKSEMERKICSLEEEIETKEKEGDILRTDNESSKSAYEKLLQEMHECKTKLVDLEEEKIRSSEIERSRVKNLQNQLEELQNNMKNEISLKNSHESNYQNLLNRYNQSEETISHLQRALVENESLNDEYSAKVDFLQRQLNLKENEVTSAKKHIVDLKECIEKLQKIALGNKEENNYQPKDTSSYQSNSLNSFEKSKEDSFDCETERTSFNPKTNLQSDQFEELQNKLKSAKELENKLQSQTDVMQKTIQEKDKLLEHSNITENSLRQRLNSLVGEVEENRKLLNGKDEENTQLQEKLFNLQTEHNNILTLMSSRNVSKSAFTQTDFERQKDMLPDVPSTTDKDADSPNSRYAKKLTALQLKLSIAEKRADILTKEKSELRDELMSYVRAKTPSDAVEFQKQISSLHEQLEAKNSFIQDLKSQLLKECASNIEKQKEVEELAKHNSQNSSPNRLAQTNLTARFAEPKLVDNIRALTKQKWQIFQEILQQQKTFYERKNIHLGHFEKYLKFIEQLRSKQVVTGALDGNNHSLAEQVLKNSEIELELDTECLQNLNIFLKRFFIPIVLKDCKCLQSDRTDGQSPTEVSSTNAILSFNMKSGQKSFASERPSSLDLEQTSKNASRSDRLISAAAIISRKLDKFDRLLGVLNKDLQNFIDDDSCREETATKSGAKKLLLKLQSEAHGLTSQIFHLNSILKLDGYKTQNLSDQESLMSEDTNLSHSGSLSPASIEDPFSFRDPKEVLSKRIPSIESIFQRSHFSSPDLGIESDANHESSAPEENRTKYSNVSHGQESTSRSRVLHAIGELKQFELLKKEIGESLVEIKGVISRTVAGLQHCTKYSSPRKTVEYTTFKAIRDASEDIETCLQTGCKIMDSFQVSTCPSEEDIHALRLQNEELIMKLKNLQEAKKRQDIEYQKAMERLKEDEAQREEREKKISKKLVKTKKVLRVMNHWMTEFEAQPRLPPIPRYTDDDRPKESEK